MWRCVELSDFYTGEYCRPGKVEPLRVVPPTEVPPKPPVSEPATPSPAKFKVLFKKVKRVTKAGTAFLQVQVTGKGYLVAKSGTVRKVVHNRGGEDALGPEPGQGQGSDRPQPDGPGAGDGEDHLHPDEGAKVVKTRPLVLVKE